MCIRLDTISALDRMTDRQTELVKQYRAVCVHSMLTSDKNSAYIRLLMKILSNFVPLISPRINLLTGRVKCSAK